MEKIQFNKGNPFVEVILVSNILRNHWIAQKKPFKPQMTPELIKLAQKAKELEWREKVLVDAYFQKTKKT